jgi:SAM-dependent methyltransferase
MIRKLKDIYHRQEFYPGFIGIFVNPFYHARLGLRKAMSIFSSELKGRLLDVGCGSKPYQELFAVDDYIGLDIDSEASRNRKIADYFYDGKTFPFNEDEYDSVLCNQVLEHVFNPDEFLSEIKRVLKPGGRLLLTVPFVWDEHEQPHDYARYSSFGLKALLDKNGFNVIGYKKIGADASTILQLINVYLYKIFVKWPLPIRVLTTMSLMSLFNLLGIMLGMLLPRNPDLFLDQIVLAEKNN